MEPKFRDPFITVVIAAFNEEKYLPRCLESLSKQTYPKDRFEVTVVDNNSTDKTAQIAKEFGALVISEKRQGNTYAIKRGMDEAKGDIIAATDADSQVANNWISVIARTFADPDVVAATGLVHVDTKSIIMGKVMDAFYSVFMHVWAFIGKTNLSGFNLAVRRESYLRVGGVNALFTMSSDVDLGIRLHGIGKVKLINDMRVITSSRRFEGNFFPTLLDYVKGHIYAVWLRNPPPVKQAVVR